MLELFLLIIGLKCRRYYGSRVQPQGVLRSDRGECFSRAEPVNYNKSRLIGLLESVKNALLVWLQFCLNFRKFYGVTRARIFDRSLDKTP